MNLDLSRKTGAEGCANSGLHLGSRQAPQTQTYRALALSRKTHSWLWETQGSFLGGEEDRLPKWHWMAFLCLIQIVCACSCACPHTCASGCTHTQCLVHHPCVRASSLTTALWTSRGLAPLSQLGHSHFWWAEGSGWFSAWASAGSWKGAFLYIEGQMPASANNGQAHEEIKASTRTKETPTVLLTLTIL